MEEAEEEMKKEKRKEKSYPHHHQLAAPGLNSEALLATGKTAKPFSSYTDGLLLTNFPLCVSFLMLS